MPRTLFSSPTYPRFAFTSALPMGTPFEYATWLASSLYPSSSVSLARSASVFFMSTVSPYWKPVPPTSVAPCSRKASGNEIGWVSGVASGSWML